MSLKERRFRKFKILELILEEKKELSSYEKDFIKTTFDGGKTDDTERIEQLTNYFELSNDCVKKIKNVIDSYND